MKHGKKMAYGGKKMMAGGKAKKPMMKKGGSKSKAGLKALAKSGPKGKAAVKKMGFDPSKLAAAMGGLRDAIAAVKKEQGAMTKAMKKMYGGTGSSKKMK